MYFIKRICIYVLLILLFVSIYNDLTIGTPFKTKDESIHISTEINKHDFSTAFVKVQAGDTVLSKVEQLNGNLPSNINISKIMTDFKTINPHVDPHKLKINTPYFFPIY